MARLQISQVLLKRSPPWVDDPAFVTFWDHDEEEEKSLFVILSRETFQDMGEPSVLTITLEPKDTLNA